MTNTLMPPSSSPLEKAVDLTAARHIEAIPVRRIFDQYHPQHCPTSLLGWLAWAVSVDDWNPDWPEQVKRDVIESSISVHRHKGTPYSIKKALASLAVKTQVSEWQDDPHRNVPHSFTVKAFANSTLGSDSAVMLSEQFYDLVKRQVNNNKAARSQFELQVGAEYATGINLSTALQGTSIRRDRAHAKTQPIVRRLNGALATATQAASIRRDRTQVKTQPIVRRLNGVLATATQAAGVLRLTMVATGGITA